MARYQKQRTQYPMGTVSCGTMRPEDTIPTFLCELENLAKRGGGDVSRKQRREHGLAEYEAGNFGFVGVQARAEIQFQPDGSIQTLTSGGLWGLESDSQGSYYTLIEKEELADLKGTLVAAGFGRRAVAAAFKSVERRD